MKKVPLSKIFPPTSPFVRYVLGELPGLFSGHYLSEKDYFEQARLVESRPYPRKELASFLSRLNRLYEAGPVTEHNIRILEQEGTLVIVGGQQAGLFGGPLFTLLKAISVILAAEELRSRLGKPVLPVFWIASDDHDFAEINRIILPGVNGEPETIIFNPPQTIERLPVAEIVLPPSINEVFSELRARLPKSEFASDFQLILQNCYVPGRSMSEAFARLLHRLLPDTGLILVDPYHHEFKKMAVPLFRREIEEKSPVSRMVLEHSRLLNEKGITPRLNLHPDYLNLFIHSPGRETLVFANNRIQNKQTGQQFSPEELIRILENEPERFSPNAALRPLVQDFIFPTLGLVLGPSELEYFAQLKAAYEWFEIPMPIPIPRISATVLDPRSQRLLKKHKLSPAEILLDDGHFAERILRQELPRDLLDRFAVGRRQVEEVWKGLQVQLAKFDSNLDKAAEVSGHRILSQFDFVEKKLLQAIKKRNEVLRSQLAYLQNMFFPANKLQERVFHVGYFWSKYGQDLSSKIMEQVDVFDPSHFIIFPGG